MAFTFRLLLTLFLTSILLVTSSFAHPVPKWYSVVEKILKDTEDNKHYTNPLNFFINYDDISFTNPPADYRRKSFSSPSPTRCTIQFSTEEIDSITERFKAYDWQQIEVVEVVLKHEIAHCIDYPAKSTQMQKAIDVVSIFSTPLKLNEEQQIQYIEKLLTHWQEDPLALTQLLESYADVYAFTWLALSYDEDKWVKHLTDWIEWRHLSQILKNNKGHDTTKGLTILLEIGYGNLHQLSPQEVRLLSISIARKLAISDILTPEHLSILNTLPKNKFSSTNH